LGYEYVECTSGNSARGGARGLGLRGSRGDYADDVQLWETESAENGQARLQKIADDSYRVLGMLAAPEKYDGVPIQLAEEVGATTEKDVLAYEKKLECPRGCKGRPPGATPLGAPSHELGSPSSMPDPMRSRLHTVVHHH
jgi:hypothetical protein